MQKNAPLNEIQDATPLINYAAYAEPKILKAEQRHLNQSLSELGILNPIILWRSPSGELFTLDGSKRLNWARQQKITQVPTLTFEASENPQHILGYLLSSNESKVFASTISKLLFLSVAFQIDTPRQEIIHTWLRTLQIESHEIILQRCERILALSPEVLKYCHEKRFSLKQCVHLTTHNKGLVNQIFGLKKHLHLSASILEELLEYSGDLIRSQSHTMESLFSDQEWQNILSGNHNKQEATALARTFLRKKRFPVLTNANDNLEKKFADLSLPENIRLQWDRTLENQAVSLSLQIKSPELLEETVALLADEQLKSGIRNLMNEI